MSVEKISANVIEGFIDYFVSDQIDFNELIIRTGDNGIDTSYYEIKSGVRTVYFTNITASISDVLTFYDDPYNQISIYINDFESRMVEPGFDIDWTGVTLIGSNPFINLNAIGLDIRVTEDIFTANPGQTHFSLSQVPCIKESMDVHVDGIFLPRNKFSFVDSVLILDSPLSGGEEVDVKAVTPRVPTSGEKKIKYIGAWDADTNTPTLGDNGYGGVQGDYYVVNVAGTTSIDGISDWDVQDWIVNNGSKWEKIDNTDTVISVAGKTGVVVLYPADVGLGNVTNDLQIPQSIVTAKGNLITATGDSTPVKLAVGSPGSILKADPSTVTGLKWSDPDVSGGVFTQEGSNSNTKFIRYLLNNTTTNDSFISLYVDGVSIGIVIPENTMYKFKIEIVGHEVTGTEHCAYGVNGVIRRNNSNSTSILGSSVKEIFAESNSDFDVNVSADDVNEELSIKVKGLASKTINWTASAELTHVGFAT